MHFRILTHRGNHVINSPFVFTQKEAKDRIENAQEMEKVNKRGVEFIMSESITHSPEEIYDPRYRDPMFISKDDLDILVSILQSKFKRREVNKPIDKKFQRSAYSMQKRMNNWLRERVNKTKP